MSGDLFGRVAYAEIGGVRLTGYDLRFEVIKHDRGARNTLALDLYNLDPEARAEVARATRQTTVGFWAVSKARAILGTKLAGRARVPAMILQNLRKSRRDTPF